MKKAGLPGDYACPLEAALHVIGGRWKGIVLYQLLTKGTLRFSELRKLLPARLTKQGLANQLRELEIDGVIHREVHPVMPPRVEYSLTELGEKLRPLLPGLCDWGAAYEITISVGNAGQTP